MASLQDRTAVVTGGRLGVGGGIVRELVQHGANVYFTSRKPQDSAVDGTGTGICCDHRVDAEVEAAFGRILAESGGIDILVNNVWGGGGGGVGGGGLAWSGPFWGEPLWRWDAMFEAGVRAHGRGGRGAAPRGGGGGGGVSLSISRSGQRRNVLAMWRMASRKRQRTS